MKYYVYGMRLRGFSLGCQPAYGLICQVDSEDSRYYDLLVYARKLDENEVFCHELDYLGTVDEYFKGKKWR